MNNTIKGRILDSHQIKVKEPKRWNSPRPEKCDICGQNLLLFFIDGRTKDGQWAIMCLSCHIEFGIEIGLGRGQMYDAQTLEKVEG